jgi:1-acyl-sn-glycerol-3-phosphate acyltransferase
MSNWQMVAIVSVSVVAMGSLALVRWRYREFTIPQLFLLFTAKVLVKVLWRAQQPKRWPLPRGQGAVLVCNHQSSVDPFFIQTIADRPIRWMVAREYFGKGGMGLFLRICNAIPVGRGGVDTAATKSAMRWASGGGLLGMLPEGRINVTDQFMLPVRPGAIMVALNARVPILPCYIEGAPYRGTVGSPFFTRARVRVVIGEPIDLSAYYDRKAEEGLAGELMLQVVQKIAALAGREGFQPQLAGRHWKPRETTAAAEGETQAPEKGEI